MKITLAHGSGGKSTSELIDKVFAKHFSNPILNMMEDSAVVGGASKIAVTTDSFVVTPLIFKGGNIGRLSICGTVNDLLMRGAVPKYITSAFIIEEGADTETLEIIASSMAQTAEEAGVTIICGDTKVIEGNGGVYINTTGVGFVKESTDIVSTNLRQGDAIVVSGTMGDHHAAILSARMNIENNIESDNAPLGEMVQKMLKAGIEIHCMRDITRGGLGTVLNELAKASKVNIELDEIAIPVTAEVKSFAKILGLDIMHMGNEGKLTAVMPMEQAQQAVEIMKSCKYGENAQIIGRVNSGSGVTLVTELGGKRQVNVLYGEGLPRIC
ncbi:MAG: hydrogenase expression/formation protein HypE [Acetobacter sp.]|nr:hydrogenase expression/formation protein HypE [Bacteroides sp.]MCM1341166.1 hydrogenase expression/formation protein HypE [Acetobacter sp.]MCM1433500.1 hydrogenase expression/formation protein HypE [Clostridiales bacterium]